MLGPDEDQRPAPSRLTETPDQDVDLRCVPRMDELAAQPAPVGGRFALVSVGYGVGRVGGGELPGSTLQGGREEERLSIGGGLPDDSVHGRLEPHVEHPVGLVEDQMADVVEPDGAPLDQIFEAARAGDQDVGSSGPLGLGLDAHPAVDGRDRDAPRPTERLHLVDYLGSEFPGRCEYQDRRLPGFRVDQVDQGRPESEGLARSRRRLDQDVAAIEDVPDDHLLDREWFGESALL